MKVSLSNVPLGPTPTPTLPQLQQQQRHSRTNLLDFQGLLEGLFVQRAIRTNTNKITTITPPPPPPPPQLQQQSRTTNLLDLQGLLEGLFVQRAIGTGQGSELFVNPCVRPFILPEKNDKSVVVSYSLSGATLRWHSDIPGLS